MLRFTPPPQCRLGLPPTMPRYWSTLCTRRILLRWTIIVSEGEGGAGWCPVDHKNTWEGVMRTIHADKFAPDFKWWLDRCNKCIQLNVGYVNKSLKKYPANCNHCVFIYVFQFDFEYTLYVSKRFTANVCIDTFQDATNNEIAEYGLKPVQLRSGLEGMVNAMWSTGTVSREYNANEMPSI
jgi:hypothetical protein